MSKRELLVGVGDSSFCQLPCPKAPSWGEVHGDCNSSSNVASQHKISQIACGATMALSVVAVEGNKGRPSSLQEWGTDLYGERLSPVTPSPPDDELAGALTADPPPANHPTRPFSIPPLGLGAAPPAIRHIACGAHFVVASLQAGGCVSWGGGREAGKLLGRAGCGSCDPCSRLSSSRENRSTPVAATANPPSSRRSAGCKPSWVAEPLGLGGSQVSNLAAGDDHTVAVCADGSAWAWGRGDCGQLGCGADTSSSCVPLAVRVPCAAASRAPVATANNTGNGDASEVLHCPGAAKVVAAACGRDHSAALTDDGRVWTFGSGLHGQLGLGTVGEMAWTPAAVESLDGVGTMRPDGSFTGIASVACGAWHTAVLSTTGDVYAWGWRRHGALGPSPSASQQSGGEMDERATPSTGCAERDTDGQRRFSETSSAAPAPARKAEEEGEVRPYPGLVEGLDDLLGDDDDQLVSVSCGARYTLVVSRTRRAFVWGQVAPADDHQSLEAGGGCGNSEGVTSHKATAGKGTARGGTDALIRVPFSSPRELRPAELLRAAGDSAAAAAGVAGSRRLPGRGLRCSCASGAGGATAANISGGVLGKSAAADAAASTDLRWRVSAVGCGPWYVVLGLEESRQAARVNAA
ncbi:unnamed protein product [Scytosiphon promiscuus]